MTIAELPLVPVPAVAEGTPLRRITVERFAGPCGAVIGGVDLAEDLDDVTIGEIRRALLDHGVVFFRNQASPRTSRSRSAGGSVRTARSRSCNRSRSTTR